uniref:RING-type E3 ubiquitin transferase n=1 Tax=Amphiprion percula TaxID=161767 RepID=A0A3P8SBZ8_AMPPE
MDDCTEKQQPLDAAVIIVENEAEPVREEKSGTAAHVYLDTCPVCQLNFHSREPKLLPCLHSFCKKCLPSPSRNLAMPEPPNSQVDMNVIRCPVCRQECMEVDVMDNVFVKDSVEAPSSTVERTVQLCMTCDDNTEAAAFCVDCVEYLCATCVEAHQRVKFTKDHTIRQKTEIPQEVHGVSTQRPMFCDIHKQEPLKLFCETCDLLTCRDCQLVKHKDHNYQFLEDAYKNHKQHMETMTHQLQEKRKLIEEVSDSINNGLLLVDQNRTSIHNEIKKSICSLILEINKKGKMLVSQLEAVTKDHESVLRKQQEDIGYLSRHLDHVISFTKWATARNGGMALLYCKRLILFQIGNLLQAKCSVSFVPQSTVRFQCLASYWASNVDLGSLVVESVPGHQLGGCQGIPHQLTHPGQGPSGSPHSFALGAPHSTLAQLQMQVDKLNPLANWQPQPPPPPWTWYQSVRLPRTVPGPQRVGSPSHNMNPQLGRRFVMPLTNHVSPTSSLPSPRFAPQVIVPFCPTYVSRRNESAGPVYMMNPNYPQGVMLSLPNRNGMFIHQCYCTFVSFCDLTVSWKPPEAHRANGGVGSAVKRKRRSSPGPIIVIKDEPDDDSSYAHSYQRANLPDSTDDQPQIMAEEQQLDQNQARLEDSNEVWCVVCQTGGELLCCNKCTKVFHLTCHVPSLLKSPSGEWLCSFCRDLLVPEMEFDCKPEAKTVKTETDFQGGFAPVDKQVCANNRLAVKLPMNLSTVKRRLEAKHSLCYQSTAEFVSDIRLIFRNCAVVTEITKACRELKELFEQYLKLIYPDQTFPEIKQEMIPTAPPETQVSPLDSMPQLAKCQCTCSDSQETPSCPSGEEAPVSSRISPHSMALCVVLLCALVGVLLGQGKLPL